MERAILHCDLNNFYASVECVKNPELKNKPIAVCGNEDDRHGIVLAKSQEAKLCGVTTGDTVSEAKRKCRSITIIHPDFDSYLKYSDEVKKIYGKYTDLIEPFGLDECWLDVSGSSMLFGNGEEIADKIRNDVKNTTGLTISVGVSFNKVFSKLGSDMKKPDAVTVISKDDFKEKIWNIPANDMLWVGRRTYRTLQKYGICTIGDIARTHPSFLRKLLGKNGFDLWIYANGMDTSPVSHKDFKTPVKSIGRGITCIDNLTCNEEVERVIIELCKSVSKSLHRERMLATSIQLSIKNCLLSTQQYSAHLEFPTNSEKEIYEEAYRLFVEKHNWKEDIRSVTVRAVNLVCENNFQQIVIGYDIDGHEKNNALEKALTDIRNSYGKNMIFTGSKLMGTKIPSNKPEYSVLPTAL